LGAAKNIPNRLYMIQKSSFKANRWMANRHLQTLWPSTFRQLNPVPVKRHAISTPDKDIIYLDCVGGSPFCDQKEEAKSPDNATPLIIMLHGLTGSSESNYIRGLQIAIDNKGWRSVTLNFRGCIEHPNLKANSYHSGQTCDLEYVYTQIREREPETPIALIGFSLGGNMVLKWLGQAAKPLSVFAVCAVSVPFELDKCANTLNKGFSKLYQKHLVDGLRESYLLKKDYLRSQGHLEELNRLEALADMSAMNTFWKFDHHITAVLNGFDSVNHYYNESSSRQYIKYIKVPTLMIQAEDDPFLCKSSIPTNQDLSSYTTLELSKQGGHVGFIGGRSPGSSAYWLDQRIPAFLQQQLNT